MRVSGKVVVVTGAGRGIGAGLARRFSREGAAAVVVADIDLGAVDADSRRGRRSRPAGRRGR